MRRILLALGILLACSTSASAAITVDNAKDCGFAASGTNTCAYTVTAATTLWCDALLSNAFTITGVTYNAVSMTQVGSAVNDGAGLLYLFRLDNPATGTHNAVATGSGATNVNLGCVSLNGSATGAPEASQTALNNSGAASTLSVSVTTISANAWVLTFGSVHAGAGTPTGTGAIVHTYSTSATYQFIGDTGAIASPGPITTGISNGGSAGDMGLVTVAVAPAGGSSPPGCKNGLLMNGVGCLAR